MRERGRKQRNQVERREIKNLKMIFTEVAE